jgi:hypothetical protein
LQRRFFEGGFWTILCRFPFKKDNETVARHADCAL